MDSESDPRRAHQEEIFEAIIDCALKGDADGYKSFNLEWDRLDPRGANGEQIRFGDGPPIPYTADGYCYHCGDEWKVYGVALGQIIPGTAHSVHMATQCPSREDCSCWSGVENPDGAFKHPLCQKCEQPEPSCACEGGIWRGPCSMAELEEREYGSGFSDL